MSQLPEERLGQLRVAKLRALLGDRVVGEPVTSGPFGAGAVVLGVDGTAGFLVEDAGPRSLGGTVVWAVRNGAERVVVIVDASPAIAARLAREATWFELSIAVERIEGTTATLVLPAPFDRVEPEPPLPSAISELIAEAAAVAEAAGADIRTVVEHGVTRVELRGLEVARVVDGAEGPVLEVGVGRFDREISAMMFSNVPTAEALTKAVEMVARYRAPGTTPHPLRDLVPERWLRELVLADPASVGAISLQRAETTVRIDSLRDPQPAAALGVSTDGEPIVVVCTSGVDLDVVPLAADTRAHLAPDAGLVIAAPARNLLDAVRATGDRLLSPPRFVAVELPY